SPVLVMDEKGRFVIPLLSGHVGGANELAALISSRINAQNVVTTATDVEQKFAVDVFAKNNGLKIVNKDGIKQISAKVLKNEKLTVWVNPEIVIKDKNVPECLSLIMEKTKPAYADILIDLPRSVLLKEKDCTLLLVPRLYCAGIGCKKGKSFEDLRAFLEANFDKTELLYAVSSIDLKKNEIGLMTLAQYYHLPFITFSAEELKLAQGSFLESEFVEKTTGVSNVCERAAVLCAGAGAGLVLAKTAQDGMTLAVAERKPVIADWGCS
ncbi:MAG: cobalamin biosynthesis protein, partial [Spirochaetaceae bacterium]|nr:cobalamin biosynthesis protein [Spirochaetaceae bacterium]